MKKLLLTLSCTALAIGLSARSASADLFQFTITGTTDPGSGFITGTHVTGQPGVFNVTNITGTISGMSISSLIGAGIYPVDPNPNPTQNFSNDDLLYSPGTAQLGQTIGGQPGQNAAVDIRGISFVLGGSNYNLFYGSFGTGFPVAYNLTYGANLQNDDVLGGFTLVDLSTPVVTPEPTSLILFGTGALGLAATLRRRLFASV